MTYSLPAPSSPASPASPAKAAKAAGAPVNPEMRVGAAIPLVLWLVWRNIRRIHARLNGTH